MQYYWHKYQIIFLVVGVEQAATEIESSLDELPDKELTDDIHFYNDIDTWELYDLKKDPSEMHNLYGQPGYEKITTQLHQQLEDLQKQYDVRPEDRWAE